ncbi:MAG: OadG family protein [Spirochaetaceae bacterium]|jgi:oxaloacetate decarboxylase gamma subunit|nr:OadG family protein [Spirochaetaceae bacterium]
MTIAEMLEQSGVLTLLGMGIVFGFLVVLIVCVSLVGKVIHALGVDKDVTTPITTGASPGGGVSAGNAAVTAAISAAVNEYRKTANP